MSEISDAARAQVLVSDFAATDAVGKLNVIGGGITWFVSPPGNPTPGMSVTAMAEVPEAFAGQTYSFALELWDIQHDRIQELPDESGTAQAVRFAQVVNVDPAQLPPGVQRPTDMLIRHIMLASFPGGLGLSAGSFEWRVQIDSQSEADWSARFHVLGPPPPPVFGGPANPSSIPGVSEPS